MSVDSFTFSKLHGIRYVVSEHAMVARWVFPDDPFVVYEPKDEKWCRFFGIGHEVREPGAYQVGEVMVIHPVIMDAMRRETERLEERRRRAFESPVGESKRIFVSGAFA